MLALDGPHFGKDDGVDTGGDGRDAHAVCGSVGTVSIPAWILSASGKEVPGVASARTAAPERAT